MAKMKVLLVQDVEHLGREGDIKEVARGFGRNYLIPKGYAVLATRGQIRQVEERVQARRRREEAARTDAEALANRLNGKTLRFVVRVGELDRLYGSVTSADIAGKITEELGIEIDRRKIELGDPIKRIGIYPVKIRLFSGIEPVINVVVEAEAGDIEVPPQEGDHPDTTETADTTETTEAAEASS